MTKVVVKADTASTIQLASTDTRWFVTQEDIPILSAQFRAEHHFRLPGILEASLLQTIRSQIDEADFQPRIHEDIGPNKELCMQPGSAALGLLHFLVNDPLLFQLIQQATECDPIGCFTGRVYRVVPGGEHHDAWHNDLGNHRMVAMSINLSPESYRGGILQIRDARSRRLLQEIPNVGFGDAIVFRLASDLEHRITEVEGSVAKTAFAGWFCSQPTFRSFLAGLSSHAHHAKR